MIQNQDFAGLAAFPDFLDFYADLLFLCFYFFVRSLVQFFLQAWFAATCNWRIKKCIQLWFRSSHCSLSGILPIIGFPAHIKSWNCNEFFSSFPIQQKKRAVLFYLKYEILTRNYHHTRQHHCWVKHKLNNLMKRNLTIKHPRHSLGIAVPLYLVFSQLSCF